MFWLVQRFRLSSAKLMIDASRPVHVHFSSLTMTLLTFVSFIVLSLTERCTVQAKYCSAISIAFSSPGGWECGGHLHGVIENEHPIIEHVRMNYTVRLHHL